MNPAEALRARKGDFSRNPHLAPLDTAFEHAVSFIGAALAKRRELERQGRLSPKGIGEAVREFADGGMNRELQRARERMQQVQADLAARRAALSRPKVEASDVAAAILRQEARAFLRSADMAARASLLLGDSPDPLMLAAVLEAPELLSGVTGPFRQQVVDRHIEVNHAHDLREFEAAEEGLALLGAAVTIAEDDIRSAAGAVAA